MWDAIGFLPLSWPHAGRQNSEVDLLTYDDCRVGWGGGGQGVCAICGLDANDYWSKHSWSVWRQYGYFTAPDGVGASLI